jgi:hypothetical protein
MPDLSGIITEAFDELQVAAPAGELCPKVGDGLK